MNIIFNEEKLNEYKSKSLLLTELYNSTCTVEGSFANLQHNEEELIDLIEPEGKLVKIDSNYGHKTLAGYVTNIEERKSNRGRKKKPKAVKPRIYQGDGSGFNSQTQITVLGSHIRIKPSIPDKHSRRSITPNETHCAIPGYNPDYENSELIDKEYKIKIFRNGKFTCPGVLCEDLSDIGEPLNEICRYFSNLFVEDVKVIELFSVMRNYKCKLLAGNIDIKAFQRFCNQHFVYLTNIKFSDVYEYLCNPIFEDTEMYPRNIGWRDFIFDNEIDVFRVDFADFKTYLTDSKSIKNLFVDTDKLQAEINNVIPLTEIYQKIKKFVLTINENYFIELADELIQKIITCMIQPELTKIENMFKKSRDNLLSYIKYDPEKYPGFLIKIKTPNANKPEKKTTIKIFPSGKINIDGANNRYEAEYIYYWLNNLLLENPNLIYDNSIIVHSSDSEFSSDDEN